MEKKKHIHIIGICGVATSALAIAFHKKGWKVTGSDKGFYPPVSTHLDEAGVSYYAGWHPEKMSADGNPDIVMIGGNGKSSTNPETLYAQENNIPTFSYPEIIEKYFLNKNTIVCVGTWGKTTTSTLLSFILEEAGFNPSYMFGGISLSQKDAAKLSNSEWTVLEGDEYTGSQTDNVAKFFHYHPTHLLLTSVSWDHADVYPTEELYFDAFKKLTSALPKDALIVACTDNEGVKTIISNTKDAHIVTYGQKSDAQYIYSDVKHSKEGISLTITNNDSKYEVKSPMLGAYNAENITACFAMAHSIGIEAQVIISIIEQFKGIKRRLEKRHEGKVTVLDCHAPTADKATAVLESIKEVYDKKIIVVFEPNIGGRQIKTAHLYDNAFKKATMVIIPHLTKLKVAQNSNDIPVEGDYLTKIIAQTHKGAYYIDNDDTLIEHLLNNAKEGDVIAFLGSHGFRGMIEAIISRLKERSM